MNDCRHIEPLLYLYRDHELSDDERKTVAEHIEKCSQCREILQQLHSIDNALVPVRESGAELSGDAALVNETIRRISAPKGTGAAEKRTVFVLDESFGWLRPALGTLLLLAVAVFLIQVSRDTVKVVGLEQRLQAHGNLVKPGNSFTDMEPLRLLNNSLLNKRTPFSPQVNTAGVISDPMKLVGTGVLNMFFHHNGLFEDLARKYPNLSSITLEDGIDERERNILATEGKEFAKEFEQLVREGEK